MGEGLRRQSLPLGAFDQRRTLLRDHDRQAVDVGRGDGRHYRSVDYAQSVDAVHAQFAVDEADRALPIMQVQLA